MYLKEVRYLGTKLDKPGSDTMCIGWEAASDAEQMLMSMFTMREQITLPYAQHLSPQAHFHTIPYVPQNQGMSLVASRATTISYNKPLRW